MAVHIQKEFKVFFNHFGGALEGCYENAYNIWSQIDELNKTFLINITDSGYAYNYEIKLDCKNVVGYLQKHLKWKFPTSCHLVLDVTYSDTQGLKYIPTIPLEIFLQDIYLAGALCKPGVINLTPNRIESTNKQELTVKPLYSDFIELCYERCSEWGWPKFEILEFNQVWDWLEKLQLTNRIIALTPASKACSSIIGLAGSGWLGPFEILSASLVLESLLTNNKNGVSGQVRNRLKNVLGEPQNDKKWITSFYELRSQIIHGSARMLRPHAEIDFDNDAEQLYLTYSTYVHRAVGIIIALLQQLIKNKSQRFIFTEQVSYD